MLIASFAYSQTERIDSVKAVLSSPTLTAEERASAVFELGLIYRTLSPDSTMHYARESVMQMEEAGQDSLYKVSMLLLANAFIELHQTDSASRYYQLIIQKSDTSDILSKAINGLGIVAQYSDRNYEALEYYMQSRDIDQKLGDERGLMASDLNIATIMHQFGQLEEAMIYTKEALAMSYKLNYTEGIMHSLVSLSNEFLNNQNYDSAVYYAQKAIEVANKANYPFGEMMAYLPLVDALYWLGDFEQARALSMKGLQLAQSFEVSSLQEKFKLFLAFSYYGLQDYRQALHWADQVTLPTLQKRKHEALTGIWAGVGRPELTAYHLKRFSRISDSLSNLSLKNKVAELQTRYRTQKKDQEISDLVRQATIQGLELSRHNNQLLMGGLSILVLILITLWYYQRDKAKKERAVLELEQRFLRSQLNPHFMFNSMTGIQQYLRSNDTLSASNYLGIFSTLMRQTLENSREEFISLQEEVKMLQNYLELQKMRRCEEFTYEVIVDEALDEEYIGVPPMFAQPFIENALNHGLFRDKQRPNKIRIEFRKEGELVVLQIVDTGIGVQIGQGKQAHRSLSTEITKERLTLMENVSRRRLYFSTGNVSDEGKITGYAVKMSLPTRPMIS